MSWIIFNSLIKIDPLAIPPQKYILNKYLALYMLRDLETEKLQVCYLQFQIDEIIIYNFIQ